MEDARDEEKYNVIHGETEVKEVKMSFRNPGGHQGGIRYRMSSPPSESEPESEEREREREREREWALNLKTLLDI
jgi:hypothetical protein